MKSEIAQLQAATGPRVSMLTSLPIERADRDRFTQFVRESDADRLAHDLATGGGNARTNAGKIAALNAMRGGIADALGNDTRLQLAQMQGANQMAVEGQRGARGGQGSNYRLSPSVDLERESSRGGRRDRELGGQAS
jgi:hypothetical protein